LHDFLADGLIKSRLINAVLATNSLSRGQKLLGADTPHLKRKRHEDDFLVPLCAPVAFRLSGLSTGRPAACSDTLPLWQQLQQALALEEIETSDFKNIASLSL
jgi:hypothetical protein